MQQAIGKYRWTICSLLFFATTVNYLDRAVISLLKPYLAKDFGWTAAQEAGNYADIEMAFKLSYAIGMLFAGRLIDKLGTKIGYALATTLWSIAAICHAFAKGTLGFSIARVFLGVTEARNFPAAIKATGEWFPKKERALATGIFNSGANIGAIIAPLSVPLIADEWGWQWAFIITGAIGLIWLILWFIYYEVPRKQKRLSAPEFEYIESDKTDPASPSEEESSPKLSWARLLTYRQTWAFAVGKFLTDPVWWFYLFWLPDETDGLRYYATLNMENQQYVSPEFYTKHVVDKVGSGDCFMGGLIHGLYTKQLPQHVIDFAAAAAFGKLQEQGDTTNQHIQDVNKILEKEWIEQK